MGTKKRRNHGARHVKKRRKIDLVAISRRVNAKKKLSQMNLGSQPGRSHPVASPLGLSAVQQEHSDSSDSIDEQEPTPYEQLLTTLGTAAADEYTDEDVWEQDEETVGEDDDDADTSEEDRESVEESNGEQASGIEDAGLETSDVVEEEDDDDESDDEGSEDEDSDDNDSSEEEDVKTDLKDPFFKRVSHYIGESTAAELASCQVKHTVQTKYTALGRAVFTSMCSKRPTVLTIPKAVSYKELCIKKRISAQWQQDNKQFVEQHPQLSADCLFTRLQLELFTIFNSYQDLLYTERTHHNAEEIHNVLCLHLLNHMVKSREVVLKHNTRLSKDPSLDTETMRDQGLTRPRVLVVVPFRDCALRLVNKLLSLLLAADSQNIGRRKRFSDEYGDIDKPTAKKVAMPEDWEAVFAGNVDDHFRIGLSITRKRLQLYTDFYMSDVIIASPLGLRTLIGAEGEKHKDCDFLASIELLVLDQADVFLMQNWEHITHLMEHLHLQPRDSHGVDFSRLREWTLNGWGKYYRQTVILSSVVAPEINSLFNKHCVNFAGKVAVCNPPLKGSVCQVVTQLPQVLHRLDCQSFTDVADKRFEFFVSKVLPQYKDPGMLGTLIYVPQYFDFVRLRNYLRKQEIRFGQICEYTTQPNTSRARLYIANGSRHLLLYTERFHFFRRYKLKGIRNLVFYQLPTFPQFYSEMCNMVGAERGMVEHNCSIIYTRYDAQRLAGVVGTSRCAHMLASDKDVHMLVTGADS